MAYAKNNFKMLSIMRNLNAGNAQKLLCKALCIFAIRPRGHQKREESDNYVILIPVTFN